MTARHTAIVTGANHGIGAATAQALARSGSAVLCTFLRVADEPDPGTPQAYRDNRARDAEAVVARIKAEGGSAFAVEADLSDPATPAMLYDTAEEQFGPVDILVNNATAWLADTFAATATDRLGRTLQAVTAATWAQQFKVDAMGAALMMLTPSVAGNGAVTLFQWEDYMDPPFLADYKKQFKEDPNVTIFADEDEAFAKMRAGYKPDVMGPCFYEFPRWKEAGLLQPIDTAKLKNWNKISPTLRNMPGISAGGTKVWFVPHYWGNTSVTFRTDLAPEYVKKPSWNILFDPKYRGRIAIMDGVDDTVPLQSVLDWARPQKLPIVVIPGGEHFFHGLLPLLKQIVVDAWRH